MSLPYTTMELFVEKFCFSCKKEPRLPKFSYCRTCRNRKNRYFHCTSKAKLTLDEKKIKQKRQNSYSKKHRINNKEKINTKRRLENVENIEEFRIKTHLYYKITKRNRHPLLSVYRSMKNRCCNKNDSAYHYYGGRGISVCDRWLEPDSKGFDNFIKDMYPTWRKGLTIDRVDVNGNYELNNCRWVDRKTQMNNTRKQLSYKLNISDNSPIYRAHNDLTTIKEFSQEHNLPLIIVKYRYAQNWDKDWILLAEDDLRRYTYNNHQYNLTELTILSGLKFYQLHSRINVMGWSVERALTTPIARMIQKMK